MPRKPDVDPTPVQIDLLRVYKRHVDQTGKPPTVRWLAEQLGKSANAIQEQITRLEKRGDIQHVTIIRPIPSKAKRRTA
jgi:SOS-response transcriptional repressor LexA